jgi:hypothetical protein
MPQPGLRRFHDGYGVTVRRQRGEERSPYSPRIAKAEGATTGILSLTFRSSLVYVAFLFHSERRKRCAYQGSDDRDQMGALAPSDGGGHALLRKRGVLVKMTIFDDFLTISDDF